MSVIDKRRILAAIVMIGCICVAMVVISAYAAEIRC